jgi:3-methyladenine DNA glycosylase AlkD
MAAYMQDRFAFLGIPSPARRLLQRQALSGLASPTEADLTASAAQLWDLVEREYQYAACDLLSRHAGVLGPGSLGSLETFITTKPWWDSVDGLRPAVGVLVLTHPRLRRDVRRWNASDDRWLVRSSIIVQLGWKDRTDEPLLFELCAARATDTEFFVRKAIGWALREHSKRAPDAVRAFVEDHPELSGLSRREALRWLDR